MMLKNLKTLDPNRFRAMPGFEGQAKIEAEMDRRPHLDVDRRHAARLAHQTRDARQAMDAASAIGQLPREGESLHLAIGGRFALWHVVPAVLELSGQAIDSLVIATLGFSKPNIDALCGLLDAGKVRKARLLCSHYFAGTSAGIYGHAVTELAKRPGASFLSLRAHAKLLLMELLDGRTFTVESSANLRSCKNIEQLTVIADRSVYEFHRNWIGGLFAAAGE